MYIPISDNLKCALDWRWTKAGAVGSFSSKHTSHATLRQTQRAMASLGPSQSSDWTSERLIWQKNLSWILRCAAAVRLCGSRISLGIILEKDKALWEDRRDVQNKPLLNFLWEIGIFSDVEICFCHKYWMLQTPPSTNMALGFKATLSLLRVSNLKETVCTWAGVLYYSWKQRSPSDRFYVMCSMKKII